MPLFSQADFGLPRAIAPVCADGETTFLHRRDDALRRYAEDESNGMFIFRSYNDLPDVACAVAALRQVYGGP